MTTSYVPPPHTLSFIHAVEKFNSPAHLFPNTINTTTMANAPAKIPAYRPKLFLGPARHLEVRYDEPANRGVRDKFSCYADTSPLVSGVSNLHLFIPRVRDGTHVILRTPDVVSIPWLREQSAA